MLRGYRGILAAIAGLILIGASPQPSSENKTKQQKPQRHPESGPAPFAAATTEPLEIVQPPINTQPCGQDQYQSNDDLCAQWKAADAASDAAWWAMVATFVTALGTVGLFWQIKLTREAVQDTGEATKAMRAANSIAAHAQRPWISIEVKLLKYDVVKNHSLEFDYAVTFKNIGQMVAENFQASIDIVPMDHEFLDHMKTHFDRFPKDKSERDTAVIPGDSYDSAGQTMNSIDFMPWEAREGYRKDCYIIILAMCRYRIPRDTEWHYSMQGYSLGHDLSPVDNRTFIFDRIKRAFTHEIAVKRIGRSRAT